MFQLTWRAARVNRGYTLKEVAELSGVCIDTVQKYEKDSSEIPHNLKNTWLHLYEVPEDMLFFGPESDLIGKKKAS